MTKSVLKHFYIPIFHSYVMCRLIISLMGFLFSILFFLEASKSWVDPKFPTECFFFTYFCHHVSIIPSMRNYIQRMRAIRDMNRLINELESHEAEWKHTTLGARNRVLLKKWKEQISVCSLYILHHFYHHTVTPLIICIL